MNEELEKEAEQYAVENWEHYEEGQTDYKALKQAYLDSAEPREKRIAELEAQIEKMKCCSNCVYLAGCDLSGYEECKNFDKWELREKKEK